MERDELRSKIYAADWQVKKIHHLKSKLGIDEELYRELLAGYGVESSRKLTYTKANGLLFDLEQKAVDAGVWVRYRGKRPETVRAIGISPAQVRTILGLWDEVSYAKDKKAALSKFLRRIAGVDFIEWLEPKTTKTVIEALKAMKQQRLIKRGAI